MNLIHAHQLMTAASSRSGPSQKITARSDCRQLQKMAAAGLIEISIEGSANGPDAVSIERLTELGEKFLRFFHPDAHSKSPLPAVAAQSAPSSFDAPAVTKWRNKFVEMQQREIR